MFTDFILNGAGHGAVGEALGGLVGNVHFDTNLLRPYIGEDGRKYVDVETGKTKTVTNAKGQKVRVREKKVFTIKEAEAMGLESPVFNAASFTKDAWIQFDNVVIKAARLRLRAWADLAASSTYGGFNGMAKTTLEYEASSDPGEAIQDMDGIMDGRTDSPLFKTRSIPLPITHSDFWFSARRIATSMNSGQPLDTTMAEAAGRRVAELIEKNTIGTEVGMSLGALDTRYDGLNKVYGYTNYPGRVLKTDLTTPTGSNPEAVLQDVIEMLEAMYAIGMFGPFMLYHTPSYSQWLNNDYFRTGGTSANRTLRSRIEELEDIGGIRRLDFWTGSPYQMILVQMTSDVARAIVGMPLTTVQWESQGRMRRNFKVMCIQVPQIRSDYYGNCGVLHATTS